MAAMSEDLYEERFRAVQAAYEVLGDPERRSAHDRARGASAPATST